MQDILLKAFHPDARVEVTVAITTKTCRAAQVVHALAPTSAVALGRLLTGVGMMAIHNAHPGSLSLQVVSKGRIRMMYADGTDAGHVRGYVKEPNLAFPLSASERASGRHQIAPALLPGQLSVIRNDAHGNYTQSATALVSGEVDADIEHFITHSDQVDNVFACEVRLDDEGAVSHAAGLMIRALPDVVADRVTDMRSRVASGLLTDLVRQGADGQGILTALDTALEPVETPLPLKWQCRCSLDRVLRSLSLLNVSEVMEMIAAEEPVSVRCDMCAKNYLVEVDELRGLLEKMIKAQA